MIKVSTKTANFPRFSAPIGLEKRKNSTLKMSNTGIDGVIQQLILPPRKINRDLSSDFLQLRNLLAFDVEGTAENVIVENGSESILSYIFKAFCDSEKEILTSEGTFIGVYLLAQHFNIPCVRVPLTKNYAFNLPLILQSVTNNTKIIYISNPNNPTGTLLEKEQLEAFLAQVPPHILVVLDEAYYDYAININPEYARFNRLSYPNLIVLRTFSKADGLANISLGYGFADPAIINSLIQVQLTFEPSLITRSLNVDTKKNVVSIEPFVQRTAQELHRFYNCFNLLELDYVKSYGNFVMLNFKSANKAKSLVEELARSNIQVSYLAAYGLPNCIQVDVGSEIENNLFFEVFTEIIEEKLFVLSGFN